MTTERGARNRAQRPPKRRPKKTGSPRSSTRNGQEADLVLEPAPPCPLRGILPTPPEVEKLVAEELEGHPVTEAERRRLTDNFNLQYYFGGHTILYRPTEQGKEVLAVGMEDIQRFLRRCRSAVERETLLLGHPEIWQASERSASR